MLHTWGSNENISFAWTPNSAKDVMASMIYGQCLQNRNQVVRYMRQKKTDKFINFTSKISDDNKLKNRLFHT